MDINNYGRIRLGKFECCLDVQSITHSDYGNMAIAYLFEGSKGDHRVVEVRKLENKVAIFSVRFSDLEIPSEWRSSELLFRWEQDSKD